MESGIPRLQIGPRLKAGSRHGGVLKWTAKELP